jgi:uncharacterized protein YjgD (DUF1641 family)
MAQAIAFCPPPRDPKEELMGRLESAPQEHVEALLSAYDLLQKLHDRGVLDLLRGGLGSGDKILQILVDATNTPEAIRGIRNLIILAKLADSIPPEMLEGLAQAVPESLEKARTEKPLGLFALMKKMSNEDTRRALTAMTSVLEALGKGLEKPPAKE